MGPRIVKLVTFEVNLKPGCIWAVHVSHIELTAGSTDKPVHPEHCFHLALADSENLLRPLSYELCRATMTATTAPQLLLLSPPPPEEFGRMPKARYPQTNPWLSGDSHEEWSKLCRLRCTRPPDEVGRLGVGQSLQLSQQGLCRAMRGFETY